MTQPKTCGFDIIVQISEQELNDQLAIRYSNGELPQQFEQVFSDGVSNGRAQFFLDQPSLELRTGVPNEVHIHYPFNYSTLSLELPCQFTAEQLAGDILIVGSLFVRSEDNLRIIGISFQRRGGDVVFSFTPESSQSLQQALDSDPTCGNIGVTVNLIETLLGQLIGNFLENSMNEIIIDEQVVSPGNESPFIINELEAKITNVDNDRDCLTYLLSTSENTHGNAGAFTLNLIPAGRKAGIVVANDLLLGRVIRPQLAEEFGLSVEDFALPCTLLRAFNYEGVTITALRAQIRNGYIKISGNFKRSGTGWKANGSFIVKLILEISEGRITVSIPDDGYSIEVDVDYEWWVYLTAGLLGFILGPVGTILIAIGLAVGDAVMDSMAAGLVDRLSPEDFLDTSGLGIPLGEVAEGFNLESLTLDDLIIGGSIIHCSGLGVHNEGEVVLWNGDALDLDSGRIHHITDYSNRRGAWWDPERGLLTVLDDLGWYSCSHGRGLWQQGIARFKHIGGTTFESLISVEIDHAFNFAPGEEIRPESGQGYISDSEIPYGTSVEDSMLLVVRTGSGRYAKCAIWKGETFSESLPCLHVKYVTYQRGMIPPGPDVQPTESIFDAMPELEFIKSHKEELERGNEDYIAREDEYEYYESPHEPETRSRRGDDS